MSPEIMTSCLEGPLKPNDPELIRYIKKNYLQPPSSKPYQLINSNFYLNAMKSSSMGQINDILESLFRGTKNGFFVEAGALDGQFLSTTLQLEQQLNWTGLLIEPDPDSYKDLVSRNRKAWISNACLSTDPYPKQIVLELIKRKKGIITYSWLRKANSHDKSLPLIDKISEMGENVYHMAQCFPLYSYLLALNITSIDLLSLDTQGGEDQMIYNFPWDEIEVTVVIAEHYNKINNSRHNFDYTFLEFMNKKGFILLTITGEPDYIFVKWKHPILLNYDGKTYQRFPEEKIYVANYVKEGLPSNN